MQDDDSEEGLPNFIRAWRRARFLKVEELANKIGASKGMISQYETGARDPSLTRLRELAIALDVPEGYLLSVSPDDADPQIRDRLLNSSREERQKLLQMMDLVMPYDPDSKRRGLSR